MLNYYDMKSVPLVSIPMPTVICFLVFMARRPLTRVGGYSLSKKLFNFTNVLKLN